MLWGKTSFVDVLGCKSTKNQAEISMLFPYFISFFVEKALCIPKNVYLCNHEYTYLYY